MLGIYVHIPFCLRKCGYCDFHSISVEAGSVPHEAYAKAVVRQLEYETRQNDLPHSTASTPCPLGRRKRHPSGSTLSMPRFSDRGAEGLTGRGVGTIYFGGGTPSLMPPPFFEGVLNEIRRCFSVETGVEVTCEVNPATTDEEWFREIKNVGINRISIGVQSFNPKFLIVLGRIHSRDDALRTIAEAQGTGFECVSCDLMFGIPGETVSGLEDDLKMAMTFQPEHLSVYQLTIEEGTPFHGNMGVKSILPDEEGQLKQLRVAWGMLHRSGWRRYEISNYSKPGFECRHNLNYWRYGEYLGLGAGATSFVRWSVCPFVRWQSTPECVDFNQRTNGQTDQRTVFARRTTQVRDIKKYIDCKFEGAEAEDVNFQMAMGEFCFMGLRTIEGISTVDFKNFFGTDFDVIYGEVCDSLIKKGLLCESDRGTPLKTLMPAARGKFMCLEQASPAKIHEFSPGGGNTGRFLEVPRGYSLTERGLELSNQVFEAFLLPSCEKYIE